jgi:hypothetical protein
MNGWIQQADFSATDIAVEDADQAVSSWSAIDQSAADLLMQQLAVDRKEFCPWGISFTNTDGVRIHIYRQSTEDNTFTAVVSKNHLDNQLEGLPEAFVEGTIRTFFREWRILLPGHG